MDEGSVLARTFPGLARLTGYIPLSRDQVMLLLVAINEFFLGIDTYLAHRISGTIVFREWFPVVFGPIAGVLILVTGLVALRWRNFASTLATVVLLASIAVGILGSYYHFYRAILPDAPAGQRISVYFLIWAPPVLGPLSFTLVGWLGMSAAWVEDPPESGNLKLPAGFDLNLPFSKTRAYFFMVGLGTMMALVSSVLDHARHHFSDPWMWVTAAVGIFGTAVPILLGAIEKPNAGDVLAYIMAMVALVLIGPLGTLLHILANLTAGGEIVIERFIRGAPFLAPLLFTNMGILGLIVLLPPSEFRSQLLE